LYPPASAFTWLCFAYISTDCFKCGHEPLFNAYNILVFGLKVKASRVCNLTHLHLSTFKPLLYQLWGVEWESDIIRPPTPHRFVRASPDTRPEVLAYRKFIYGQP